MNIGALDRQITLQRFVSTQDAFGQQVGEWQDASPLIWAEKKFRSGQETYDADQKQAVQKVDFKIRWRIGITSELRIVETDGTIYQIDSVAEVGRRIGLTLTSYNRGEEKLTVPGV